jgi:D-3-phosphoglycerate dehydrogenase
MKVVALNAHPDLDLTYEQEALRPLGVVIERLTAVDDGAVVAAARDADVVMPMENRLSGAVIGQLERCRLIPSIGIGYDEIDVAAATARGILVTNMGDIFVEEVANTAWMLILLVAKRGLWQHEMATTNRWHEGRDALHPVLRVGMPRITGQTLGLVSFGQIARATARRAHAFGMSCLAYDPHVDPGVFREHGVEAASLDEVCGRADVVSCHAPLTAQTVHLIGEAQLRLMKPTAIFVNTGRGGVVDEAALTRALQEGRLAGAGLDVLEQEPPDPNNPLLTMPNVALSLHVASVSDGSHVERRRRIGRQVADALQGKEPVGVVNPAALPNWRGRATAAPGRTAPA